MTLPSLLHTNSLASNASVLRVGIFGVSPPTGSLTDPSRGLTLFTTRPDEGRWPPAETRDPRICISLMGLTNVFGKVQH